MPNLNKVFLIGHLTKDPEMRFTPGGVAVCGFTLATNTKRKDKDDEVYFASLVAFGSTAEAIGRYVKKGDPIFVEGRLSRDSWEDGNGNKREKTKIIVNSFQFLKGGNGQKQEPKSKQDVDVPF